MSKRKPAARPRPTTGRRSGTRAAPSIPVPDRDRALPSAVALTVEEAVRRIAAGHMIIVVDDAQRENEGDLVFAAEKASAAMVNFTVKYGRGILCAPMSAEESDRLGLKPQARSGRSPLKRAAENVVRVPEGDFVCGGPCFNPGAGESESGGRRHVGIR